MGNQHALLMVTPHREGIELPRQAQYPSAIGTAGNEVADEHDAVVLRDAQRREQLFELVRAAVHVANPHRAAHASETSPAPATAPARRPVNPFPFGCFDGPRGPPSSHEKRKTLLLPADWARP